MKRPSPRSGKNKNGSVARLRLQLREAHETLEAITTGSVDAVVVSGANGYQIYSLSGAEHPYRIYVETMQEGAVTVSDDGVVLYANRRFAEMVGSSLERVIGSDFVGRFTAEVWGRLSAVTKTDGKEAVRFDGTVRRDDGQQLPVRLAASRLPLEDRSVLCLVVTDLTEQKENADLRLAKELAERASAAKDDFLAALSHELRTPLAPALLATAALECDEALSDRVREELAVIRRNVELEARLIDDLLDLTRIVRGKLEMQSAPVDVHAVLARAIEISGADIGGKKQRLEVRLGARYTDVTGDAVRLQQALWNLLRNASKFTPEGGAITVRTGNSGGRIWIAVADEGVGFPPEAAPRLFQAFEQGGPHITRRFGGLGLGLAITRSIAEAHGGKVKAESPGHDRGATFTLELPVGTSPATAQVEAAPPPPPGVVPALRVLVVEDHEDTRLGMERLLQNDRHQVRAAASVGEARRLADREAFDLVISDLALPDESGLALMRDLRSRYGLHGIAVSGFGMEADVAQSRAAGFDHHLTKPVSLERLRRLIGEVARQDRRGRYREDS